MRTKMTKDQLLEMLSERIASFMAKETLERTKKGLELRLEAFDTGDFLWSSAADAARADIEAEQGDGAWSPLGDQEDAKSFVKGLTGAKEADVDANASTWKGHYANFNEQLVEFLTKDSVLGQVSTDNPHGFLDSMAVAMYKYMLDHHTSSPFLKAVQEWIVDLDPTFNPENEEGDVDLGPVERRIYKQLSLFEREFNRKTIGKRAARLHEERKALREALKRLDEVWEWGHSPEAYDNVRENLHNMPHEKLVEIMGEWDAYEAAGKKSSLMAADFDAVDATKHAHLPNDVLADAIFEKAQEASNTDNGGFLFWVCPYGCHKVSADVEATQEMDEAGVKGKTAPHHPMVRGEHDPKQTYDWQVFFLGAMNNVIDDEHTILNKSYAEALKYARTVLFPNIPGAVDVDLEEMKRTIKYEYTINLDERGSFNADVRDEDGKTVFEIKAGDELGEDETSIFEDGYMKHKNDIAGLEKYLKELGFMEPEAKLVSAYAEGTINEDIDDMDLDGGELSDELSPWNSDALNDVSSGHHIMPPTADDPYWYVVTADGDPLEAFETEQEAQAALAAMGEPQDAPPQFGVDFKESAESRMERLLNEAEALLQEYLAAPWDVEEPRPASPAPPHAFSLVGRDANCILLKHGQDTYAMNLEGLTPEEVQQIAIDRVGVPSSPNIDGGDPEYDTSFYGSPSDLSSDAIVDHVNGNLQHLKIGTGILDWESGNYDLVKVDDALSKELRFSYNLL